VGLAALLLRSSPNLQPVAAGVGSGAPTPAGPTPWYPPSRVLPPVTEQTALGVPAFWRGMAYVCGAVGMLPVTIFRDTEILDPQPNVVRQPDPFQTPMAFWTGVAESLTLYGNAICIVTGRDRLGYPTSLKPVHPLMTAVRFVGNPMTPDIGEFYIAGRLYDPSQIWHVKSHLSRAGWPLGRGVLDLMSDGIAMESALQSYAASYFVTGGMPLGILKIHRPEITPEQAQEAKDSWTLKFSGAPTPAVLNELTDFTPLAYRPVDSQMIESRQFGLIQTALMWGIPPSKLGASVAGMTYKNSEMEEVQARNDAVAPWTRLLEEAISIDWLPRGQRAEWDLTASLRTDTLSLFQAYQMALGGPGPTSAWLMVDEVRAKQNLDPMEIAQAEVDASVAQERIDRGLPEPAEPAPTPPLGQPIAGGPPAPNPPPTGETLPAPMATPMSVGSSNGKGT